jgi:hypothetical protein
MVGLYSDCSADNLYIVSRTHSEEEEAVGTENSERGTTEHPQNGNNGGMPSPTFHSQPPSQYTFFSVDYHHEPFETTITVFEHEQISR